MKTKSFTKRSFTVLAITILLLVAIPVTAVFAADTGFLVASASANGNGNSGWVDYDNGRVSDDVYAISNGESKRVTFYNYDIPTIAADAPILGIQVDLEGQTTGRDVTVALSWDAGATFSAQIDAGFTSGTSDVHQIVGSASDLSVWGLHSWVPGDFTNTNFRVRIASKAGSGTFSLDSVQVKVYYHYNNPPIANAQSVSTNMGVAKDITLTGSDADLDSLTFAIVDNPAHGALSGIAPDVTYTPNISFVGADSFTFKVNDGKVDSAPATISIIVNAVNSAPTDISLSPSNVDENKAAGTVVGALSTTDPDGGTFTYSFCGGADDASFQFSGSDLLTAAIFDFETKSSYSICVRSTDNGALSFDKTLTVTINNKIDTATFQDVPTNYWSWAYIESIYAAGVTGGCGTNPLVYCPTLPVTRAQMAVFLLKGIHGNTYTPPVATGSRFADVAASYWAAAWIEQLATEGITAGCSSTNYCPDDSVTRDQMAVFLLRAKHGPAFIPPPATGTVFTDVPSSYWSAAWIEQLASEAITGGCGAGVYCPLNPVTRDQMAVFLQRTFGLPMP